MITDLRPTTIGAYLQVHKEGSVEVGLKCFVDRCELFLIALVDSFLLWPDRKDVLVCVVACACGPPSNYKCCN